MPDGDGAVLAAFQQAIRREQHVLSRCPGLLWQQLYNRLQWEAEPVPAVLAGEYARRAAPGAVPWLRTRSAVRESAALVRTITAHSARITCCAYSPDNSRLVTGSSDGTLRVWEPGQGAEMATLAGHDGAVADCAVSTDGSYVVSAGSDGTLRLWDPVSGAELRALRGHTGGVRGCAVSPDGTFLISAGYDGTLRRWDPDTGAERACLSLSGSSGTGPLTCCAVGAGGALLISGTYEATIVLWGAEVLGEPDRGNGTDIVSALAIAPDESFIVSCGFENTMRLWDVRSARQRATLTGHTGRVFDCAVSPDGSYIVSASMDGTLRLWDPQNAQPVAVLAGHTWAVTACAVSPDGSTIASGGDDGVLKLWDIQTAIREQDTPAGHGRAVRDCAFALDGSFAVTASIDRTGRIWDAGNGRERAILTGHLDQVNTCAVSPDGAFAVTGSSDGTLAVWDAVTGTERARLGMPQVAFHPYKEDPELSLPVRAMGEAASLLRAAAGMGSPGSGHAGPVLCCAVSVSSTLIVSGGEDHTLRVWDAATGKETLTLEGHGGLPGWVTGCAFAPDDSYILSAGDDATLRLWNPQSGRELATLAGHAGPVTACAIAPDGSFVLSASTDATLRIWDPGNGRERVTLAGHAGAVTACAIAPDGSFVLSAGEDGTLRLWDPRTGSTRVTITGHDGPVRICAIAPDASLLVSGGADGTCRLWDARTGSGIATLPLLGEPNCLALHPSRPLICCGDQGGRVYLIEPVGAGYGPVIVTETATDGQQWLRCPGCRERHAVDDNWRGTEFTCPASGCGLRLRLSPAVLRSRGTPAQLPGMLAAAVPLGNEASAAVAAGDAAMSRHEWDTAVAHYGEALTLTHENEYCLVASAPAARAAPALAVIHGDLGTAYSYRGDYRKAIQEYDRALERDPENIYCLDNRARAEHMTGDFEEAVRGFTDALALLPPGDGRVAQLHAYRARSHSELGHLDEARQDLSDAAGLCRDPGLAETIKQAERELFPMKTCLACGNEFELLRYACPRCGSTAATAPSPEVAGYMAEHQFAAGQHVDKGSLLFKEGRYDEAEAEFREAIAANPWNATAHANIGVVMLRRDRLEDAIRWFEKALEIDPQVAGVREMLARKRAELARRGPAGAP